MATSITGNQKIQVENWKSILGQLKGILQSIFGLFTFGGVVVTFSLGVGIIPAFYKFQLEN